MVDIVGWDTVNGRRNAHVWGSHGQGHGLKGVSRIRWECGDGKLNRGLGYYAKIVQHEGECNPPDAAQVYLHEIKKGSSVQVGANQSDGTTCSWLPRKGLENPDSCVTKASPDSSTEYHLSAKSDCGTSTSMTLVNVWGRAHEKSKLVITPFGTVLR